MEARRAPAIGIDLGTAYMRTAAFDGGDCKGIPDDHGNSAMPSYVAFTDSGVLIGAAARKQAWHNPKNTIFHVLRLIGRRYSDPSVQEDMRLWSFKVVADPDDRLKVEVHWKGKLWQFSPVEICSMILTRVKENAETNLKATITDAVVTVPVCFNHEQRQAIKQAGTIAGLNFMQIISTPAAGALFYGTERLSKSSSSSEPEEYNMIIFDLGAGTLDVSLATIKESTCKVRAAAGDAHLGGCDIDSIMIHRFLKGKGKDISDIPWAISNVRALFEKAKIFCLSGDNSVPVKIIPFDDDYEVGTLSRSYLNNLSSDLIKNCIDIMDTCLRDAEMSIDTVHEVILAGGSTRIPHLQSKIRRFFKGKKLNMSQHLETAAACGAAFQACFLSRRNERPPCLSLFDAAPFSLDLRSSQEEIVVHVPKNTTIPTKIERTFSLYRYNRKNLLFEVYEDEGRPTHKKNLLGKFELSGNYISPNISVCFEIHENGTLTVRAGDISTGIGNGITLNAITSSTIEDSRRLVWEALVYKEGGISQEGAPKPNEAGETGQTSAQNLTIENQQSDQGKASSDQSKQVGQNLDVIPKLPDQQAQGVNPASAAKETPKVAPSIPFEMLMPLLRPHLDKDRDMQCLQIFMKLRSKEVSKDDFLRMIRNTVGERVLKQAAHAVHLQMQAQAKKASQTTPNTNTSTSTSTGPTSKVSLECQKSTSTSSGPQPMPNRPSMVPPPRPGNATPGTLQKTQRIGAGPAPTRDKALGKLLPQRMVPDMTGPPGQVVGRGPQISLAEPNMPASSSGPKHTPSGLRKTPSNEPSVAQKKPVDASDISPPVSKKQKTGGAFLDQSIEQLNDVTAVNWVNLRITQQEFTETAWSGIVSSPEVAKVSKHQIVETEHLMKSLLEQKNGLALRIFSKAGVDNTKLLDATENFIHRQPKVLGEAAGAMVGRDLEALIQRARKYKKADALMSIKHLVLGFVDDKRFGKQIFNHFQITVKTLRSAIESIRGRQNVIDQEKCGTGKHAKALEKYGKDLTAMAREGKLDPVIGRDDEIRRCIHILSRRTKNNPVLIGEPGVGKTAIAEGLAQRIDEGDVPQALINRRLIVLDMGALVAGTKYWGEFEARLKAVLREVADSDGQLILFIDEIHTVVGKGDAGDLLKPMLGRGELRCIGATTLDEYRKYVEKDPAFERCFQQVYVDQPSVEDTVSILRGLRKRYELHHGVRISDSALVAASLLSDRYISARFLPDKAIDLVDETAAKLKMEIASKPTSLDEIDRSVLKLEMECASLTNDTDKASKDRLARLEAELSLMKEKHAQLAEQWEHEKMVMAKIQSIKEEVDRVNLEIQLAERECDLNRASELKSGSLNSLQRQLESTEKELDDYQSSSKSMLREEVSADDIAQVVSKWTGIPVSKLKLSEREKILDLKEELHKRVIGQDPAVKAVAEAIQRSRAGLSDPDRPIASFMFMGPTGVGKTELAKALASFMFNAAEAVIRIDMSEYMEKHSVSRLIGAPPGYIGYENGGQLSEAVRRRPYGVVLLDEIEKAHPDVFNIFLQILDDGRLTDAQGRKVSFMNTVIIMTSNVGSQYILDMDESSPYETIKRRVMDAAKNIFRPEFMNRIDEFIVFMPLDREEIKNILKLQLARVQKRVADRNIRIEVSDSAIEFLGNLGYDPKYGARPVKRILQQYVENELAKGILRGDFKDEDEILIDTNFTAPSNGELLKQKLLFRKLNPEQSDR